MEGSTCAIVACGGRKTFGGWFSSHCVNPNNWILVVRHGGKHFYSLNHCFLFVLLCFSRPVSLCSLGCAGTLEIRLASSQRSPASASQLKSWATTAQLSKEAFNIHYQNSPRASRGSTSLQSGSGGQRFKSSKPSWLQNEFWGILGYIRPPVSKT